jgi:hypothetical protein
MSRGDLKIIIELPIPLKFSRAIDLLANMYVLFLFRCEHDRDTIISIEFSSLCEGRRQDDVTKKNEKKTKIQVRKRILKPRFA